jgi:hypothetical protein
MNNCNELFPVVAYSFSRHLHLQKLYVSNCNNKEFSFLGMKRGFFFYKCSTVKNAIGVSKGENFQMSTSTKKEMINDAMGYKVNKIASR